MTYASSGELLSAASRLAAEWGDAQVGFDHAAVAVLQRTLTTADGHAPEIVRIAAAISAAREGATATAQFGSRGSARALPITTELRQQLDTLAEERPRTSGGWLSWIRDGLAASPRPRLRTLASGVDSILSQVNPSEDASDRAVVVPYTLDLTSLAADRLLGPVYGRETELASVIRTLGRRSKNHPVLVGPPGVGKTAIVELLAMRVIEGNVPPGLRRWRILQLDLGGLLAGSRYRGDLEERLLHLLKALDESPTPLLLFVDEVHLLVGAGVSEGSPVDLGNLLKPALARSAIRLIGATTDLEYEDHIRRDPALERRLQPIPISEPPLADTARILEHLRPALESHHGVRLPSRIVRRAALMTARLLPHRYQPDKAIDLLDEACSLSASRAGDDDGRGRTVSDDDLLDVARSGLFGETHEVRRASRPLPRSVEELIAHGVTQALAEASLSLAPMASQIRIRGVADTAAIEAEFRARLGGIVGVSRAGVPETSADDADVVASIRIVDGTMTGEERARMAVGEGAQRELHVDVVFGNDPQLPGDLPVVLTFDAGSPDDPLDEDLAALGRSIRLLDDGANRIRLSDEALETARAWLEGHEAHDRAAAAQNLQATIATSIATNGHLVALDEDLLVTLTQVGTALVPTARPARTGQRVRSGREPTSGQ